MVSREADRGLCVCLLSTDHNPRPISSDVKLVTLAPYATYRILRRPGNCEGVFHAMDDKTKLEDLI